VSRPAHRSLTLQSVALGALAVLLLLALELSGTSVPTELREGLLGTALLAFGGAAVGRSRAQAPVQWPRPRRPTARRARPPKPPP
jgi:hypothetical protein